MMSDCVMMLDCRMMSDHWKIMLDYVRLCWMGSLKVLQRATFVGITWEYTFIGSSRLTLSAQGQPSSVRIAVDLKMMLMSALRWVFITVYVLTLALKLLRYELLACFGSKGYQSKIIASDLGF